MGQGSLHAAALTGGSPGQTPGRRVQARGVPTVTPTWMCLRSHEDTVGGALHSNGSLLTAAPPLAASLSCPRKHQGRREEQLPPADQGARPECSCGSRVQAEPGSKDPSPAPLGATPCSPPLGQLSKHGAQPRDEVRKVQRAARWPAVPASARVSHLSPASTQRSPGWDPSWPWFQVTAQHPSQLRRPPDPSWGGQPRRYKPEPGSNSHTCQVLSAHLPLWEESAR